ncbi:MAG: hypothetical protein NVS3B20_09400 [Polyangiales bacterium]
MGALDGLLDQVKKAISQHAGGDSSTLLAHVTDLFDKHPTQNRDVKPASQDPYGDPANQGAAAPRNVKPASQDPYGDPADQKK